MTSSGQASPAATQVDTDSGIKEAAKGPDKNWKAV